MTSQVRSRHFYVELELVKMSNDCKGTFDTLGIMYSCLLNLFKPQNSPIKSKTLNSKQKVFIPSLQSSIVEALKLQGKRQIFHVFSPPISWTFLQFSSGVSSLNPLLFKETISNGFKDYK